LSAFVVLGPAAARPATAVLGGPIAALHGVNGRLARDNARRNPRRTAATGVDAAGRYRRRDAVHSASMKAMAADGVDHTLTADLVVDSGGYGGASSGGDLNLQLAADLNRLPGIGLATGLASGNAVLAGNTHTISAAEPARIAQVFDLDVTHGALCDLTPNSHAAVATTSTRAQRRA
jgi:putative ABC transport system permease protein